MIRLDCVYKTSLQYSYTSKEEFEEHINKMEAEGHEVEYAACICKNKYSAIFKK